MGSATPRMLRVVESLPKDVGRGIARIDPKDIEALGAGVGDIISITGKKTTVAKLMPAYAEVRGKALIQIDGVIRDNAGVGLDERVSVQTVETAPARKIVLASLSLTQTRQREQDRQYLGRLIEGLPLVKGDRLRITFFGARSQDFQVLETVPDGAVVIQPTTQIQLRSEETGPRVTARLSYEDIGGLQKEIQKIREMIELPIKYPEVFERLGIDAPKGVLLTGPPGTGKTLIARAVAHETDVSFTHITGPEIMGKYYGEAEARLRQVFEHAQQNAPAILFIDEIESIAPKREEMGGEKQVERRVVAQLLALMDGLEARGQVIVIGATNLPNLLDPALRRPGRFDREMTIGIPDRKARQEILEIHTRGMPLADDVDLTQLAEMTHGFVGADLKALCQEAAMTALRTIFPQIEFDMAAVPYESLLALRVTMDHFLEAFKAIEPSAIREIFIEVPDVRWDQVGGLDDVKRQLIEVIEWPLTYPDLFTRAHVTPPKGIMLYGPPGTGKTLLAQAVATESAANFIAVKGPQLLSKFVGESERAVRELFKKARQAAPCIVFFDEIDAIAPVRGAGSGNAHVTEQVLSQLLTELDGIERLQHVVILGATNRIDILDPALLRPGRFDVLIKIPIPDERARRAIFQVHTTGKPLADDVNLDALARATEGLVGADIEFLCTSAAMAAIREVIERDGAATDRTRLQIRAEHFQQALTQGLHAR